MVISNSLENKNSLERERVYIYIYIYDGKFKYLIPNLQLVFVSSNHKLNQQQFLEGVLEV